MDEMIYALVVDGNRSETEFRIDEQSFLSINEITMDLVKKDNTIGIALTNNSSLKRTISLIEIQIASLDASGYLSFIINPESSNKEISVKKTGDLRKKKSVTSYLYSLLEGQEDYESLVVGFLSSRASRNFIKIVKNNNKIDIYAVYDFINQNIEGNKTLKLDDIYIEYAVGIFKLFNNYSRCVMDRTEKIKVNSRLKKGYVEENPFYLSFKDDGIIMDKNRPVTVWVNGKKQYLADISTKEGKELVLSRCNTYRNTREYVYVKDIMPYIKKIIKLKGFNPYQQIVRTLDLVRSDTGLKFMFDDCPEGIALEAMDAASGVMRMESRKRILSKSPKRQNLNYNFILKTIFWKGIFKNDTKLDLSNKKMKQIMELMSGGIDESKVMDERLKSIIKDIDVDKPIFVHIEDEELFSLIRYGKESIYIAAFNFSNISRRLYLDFSIANEKLIQKGMFFDIYSGSNYLVSNGKIYIRSISPGDCCLIGKDLNRIKVINAV